ncbi:hypothetical protein [Herbaspirillum robiniae]|uniref:hypothetical protein n=1 Tax=Herbaspirillum robiniae TaxID=2014887 RepID=UPI0009A1FE1C|nr:hypothetical protein [Herbaspirillum robiniae]
MALLDVTEVLLDPDLMDVGIVCCRQDQTVGDDGMAVNTETQTPFAGVVTSDSGDILQRIAEGSRIVGSITIHTIFRIQDGAAGRDADEVIWDGRRYTVSNVNNYSHFGRGFVAATCDLKPLSG